MLTSRSLPAADEGLGQDPHEAGQADQLGPGLGQGLGHGRLEVGPRLVVAVRDHRVGMPAASARSRPLASWRLDRTSTSSAG